MPDELYTHGIFFFQAEDGIRDTSVTGVQTCALPISEFAADLIFIGTRGLDVDLHDLAHAFEFEYDLPVVGEPGDGADDVFEEFGIEIEIGRASCRERV